MFDESFDNEIDNVIRQVKYGQVVGAWPSLQQTVSTSWAINEFIFSAENNNLSQRSNVFSMCRCNKSRSVRLTL